MKINHFQKSKPLAYIDMLSIGFWSIVLLDKPREAAIQYH